MVQVQYSCGNFCWSFCATNLVRTLSVGRAMVGNLEWSILTRLLTGGAAGRINQKWTTRRCHEVSDTIMIKTSLSRRQERDISTNLFVISRACWDTLVKKFMPWWGSVNRKNMKQNLNSSNSFFSISSFNYLAFFMYHVEKLTSNM